MFILMIRNISNGITILTEIQQNISINNDKQGIVENLDKCNFKLLNNEKIWIQTHDVWYNHLVNNDTYDKHNHTKVPVTKRADSSTVDSTSLYEMYCVLSISEAPFPFKTLELFSPPLL